MGMKSSAARDNHDRRHGHSATSGWHNPVNVGDPFVITEASQNRLIARLEAGRVEREGKGNSPTIPDELVLPPSGVELPPREQS